MDTQCVLFPVTCALCNQDQLVMVRVGPELKNFFQSIKCFWCGDWFEASVPEVVIGGPHPFEEFSHF
jgi:transcription elongation factor Elf1